MIAPVPSPCWPRRPITPRKLYRRFVVAAKIEQQHEYNAAADMRYQAWQDARASAIPERELCAIAFAASRATRPGEG